MCVHCFCSHFLSIRVLVQYRLTSLMTLEQQLVLAQEWERRMPLRSKPQCTQNHLLKPKAQIPMHSEIRKGAKENWRGITPLATGYLSSQHCLEEGKNSNNSDAR